MPTEVFGLPLHPLAVHLPVVLVPLLAVVIVAYVLVPKLRRHVGWLLLGLSVVAVAVVFVARWSGQQLAAETLAEMEGASQQIIEQQAASISDHASNGTTLLWLTLVAAPLAWLFAGFASGRLVSFLKDRSFKPLDAAEAASTQRTAIMTTVGVVLVGLAVTMTYFVIRAGHTGAEMIWGA